ncbi:MAG TPA: motility protein A [Balneolaceae bacterium]|nr:motility protein A [Balneolaceae bacterium]|tara:strand:+ start:205026 stop:205904 length:879 start_codon:yes stop_codon:yes gene_type:complete
MLDKSSLIGFILGFTLIIGSILMEGSLVVFVSVSSFILVVGGLLAATMINYSFKTIKISWETLLHLMKSAGTDMRTDMEVINLFARRVRTNGLLILDEDVQHLNDEYLKSGLQLAIDGFKTEALERILSDEIQSQERQGDVMINVMLSMSNYAPAFGMIGTVIGMVLMLQNISDPESLTAGIAVALLTTLYGSVFSNMILTPLAGKLEYLNEKDINRKQMFRVAILSIVEGENPRIMEKKMLVYIDPKDRAEYIKHHEELKIIKKRDEKFYKLWKEQQNQEWENLKKILEPG